MPQVNGKYKPNMKAPRTPYVEELPEERAQDFRPVDRGYSMADAVAEAARNMAAEFLEKMRSIGYTPQQTTELLERWNETEGEQHE